MFDFNTFRLDHQEFRYLAGGPSASPQARPRMLRRGTRPENGRLRSSPTASRSTASPRKVDSLGSQIVFSGFISGSAARPRCARIFFTTTGWSIAATKLRLPPGQSQGRELSTFCPHPRHRAALPCPKVDGVAKARVPGQHAGEVEYQGIRRRTGWQQSSSESVLVLPIESAAGDGR